MNWLIKLFKKAHAHCLWQTTAHNCWFLPIRQRCRICGRTRRVDVEGAPGLAYRWKYDDGTEPGPWLGMLSDEPVKDATSRTS